MIRWKNGKMKPCHRPDWRSFRWDHNSFFRDFYNLCRSAGGTANIRRSLAW